MDAAGGAIGGPSTSGRAVSLPERSPCAVVILGNDAVVAARPCSAWQLAHACRAAGFDIVVPPTLGDELIAGAYLARLAGDETRVAVACHCPRARHARQQSDSRVSTIRLVPPPVAAARAMRLTYGAAILVTYVGECPASDDPSINARFSPSGFLGLLERQGISLAEQPDAMPTSDAERWSRYLSMPGGLPALRWLARAPVNRVLRDADASEVDPGRWIGGRSKVLVDLSERSDCACGGHRARIEECEPARASAAVVVAPAGLDLRDDPPVVAAAPTRDAPVRSSSQAGPVSPTALGASVPTRRTDGLAIVPPERAATTPAQRQRRFAEGSEAGDRVSGASGRVTASAAPSAGTAGVPAPGTRRRSLVLFLVPLAVLAATASLGAGVYAFTSQRAPATRSSREWPFSGGDTAPRRADSASDTAASRPNAVSDTAATASSAYPLTAPAGSPSRGDSVRSSPSSSDSIAAARSGTPKQGRRKPRIEVVPGWLPQSRQTFTPVDTTRRTRRDSSTTVPSDTTPRT